MQVSTRIFSLLDKINYNQPPKTFTSRLWNRFTIEQVLLSPLLCEFGPKEWEADRAANTREEEGLWGNGRHKPEAGLYLEKCPEWCSQGQVWKPWTAAMGFMLVHHCQRARIRKATLWSLQSNYTACQGLPCGKAPDILRPTYSQMHSKEAEETEYLIEDTLDCVSLNREL